MRDDPFRRHLDEYAAVGRDSAVPPMVHEIYRRGRRHQRIQVMTWGVVGVLTLIATFLAGMVVRDQTDPAVAGVALPTTTWPGATPTTQLGGFPPGTTLFPPSTLDPGLFTTTSFDFTTTSFDFTTTSFTTTTTGSSAAVPTLTSGRHPSVIKSISGNSVTFDKVQFFRGAAATREARKDDRTPTNGWYMRNVNSGLRTLTVKSGARIQARRGTMGRSGDPNRLVTVTLSELAGKVPTSSTTLFAITLESGRIARITEYDLS
jgi:hypothetical protein